MAGYGLNEFLTELQGGTATRRAELQVVNRAIHQAIKTSDQDLVDALRRAFVLLAYAHAEGGIRIALAAYVRLVNDRRLVVDECNPQLVASAWGDLFRELVNSGSKPGKHFRGDPGNDPKLNSYARRGEFVSKLRQLGREPVSIPDDVVNTESNVDQTVLSKLLFQLGLPREWDWDRTFSGLIFLKNLRNRIAHGDIVAVSEDTCMRCELSALDSLENIRRYLERSVVEESFRRRAV